jgi:hypothetical protein
MQVVRKAPLFTPPPPMHSSKETGKLGGRRSRKQGGAELGRPSIISEALLGFFWLYFGY